MSALHFTSAHRLRPMEGLTACGDAVIVLSEGDWRLFAVIDALGHGPDAEKSARASVAAAASVRGQPLQRVFEAVHHGLSGLRGVVMSGLLMQGSDVTFAGVGNVELFSPPDVSRPVPTAGTLGGGAWRFRSTVLPLRAGQRWVLASDGIKARDASVLLPKLRAERPDAVADALLTQVTRAHDDASVLVVDVGAAS
jgi:hypothetical protein